MSHEPVTYFCYSAFVSQLEPRAESHVARGKTKHHRGHQATPDRCHAFQKLHDLSGGEPGQQGELALLAIQQILSLNYL